MFAADIAQDRCYNCPAGWQDTDEKTRCEGCVKGTYQPNPMSTVCIDCENGKYAADTNMQYCSVCPAGWQDIDEKTRCDGCVKGTYQPNPMSTVCIDCENGKYAADTNMQYCTACPAGWQDTDDKNRCDACMKGTYQKDPQQVDCIGCIPGSISAEVSSLSCENCLAGFFESGSVECKGCKKGEYQGSNVGATKCASCPLGWFTAEERGSSCTMCPKGWAESGQQQSCTACKKGQYQALDGATECLQCENGRFSDSEKLASCFDCQVGKWRKDTGKCTHDRSIPCPTSEFCQNIVGDSRTSVCITGEVCLSCDEGTYQSEMGQMDCLKCPLGFYQKLKNKDFCTSCEMGRFQTQPFVNGAKDLMVFNDGMDYGGLGGLASDCQFCPSGWNNGILNNTECLECVIGKYIGCKGGYKCWDCPAGRTSHNPETQSGIGGTECIAETVITSVPSFIEGTHKYGCNASVVNLPISTSTSSTVNSEYTKLWVVPIKAQSPGFCNTNPELCDIVRTGNSFSQQNPNHLEPFVPRIGLKNPTSDDCRYQNITTMCVTWETKSDVERAEEKGDATNGDLPYKYTGGFRIEWSVERNFPPPNEEDKNARIKTNYTLLMHAGALDWEAPENNDKCDDEDQDDTNDCETGEFRQKVEQMHLGPWTYCFETTEPVHMEMLYVRVVGIGPVDPKNGKATDGARGSPSPSTDTYVTAPTCGDVMYLSQSSYPPNGPGAWEVGKFNPRLDQWRCDPCPTGGDCRGPKRWVDVYSKFGYSRLDSYDFDSRTTAFWPCFKSLACLGGKNPLKTSIQVTYYERPPWPSKEEYFLPEPNLDNERLDMPQCCSALNPMLHDVQSCKEQGCGAVKQGEGKQNYAANSCSKRRDVPFEQLYTKQSMDSEGVNNCPDAPCPYTWNGDERWKIDGTAECQVDLARRDDFEICNEEMGFRLACNDTANGKCRLCRACASPDREGQKWFPMGVANCYKCPPKFMNTVGVFMAGGAMFAMVYMFLAAALEDSGAEANSQAEGAHLSQPMQKIILNHAQLVSLASGFPLKWPDEVEAMFTYMGMLAQASSYAFNPACSDSEGGYFPKLNGKPMPSFYQKSIVMQLMPFVAIIFACIFWLGIAIWDFCDPPQKRHARHLRQRKKRKAKKKIRDQKKIHKKAERLRKKERQKMKKQQDKTKVVPTKANKDGTAVVVNKKKQETLIDSKDPSNTVVKKYQKVSGRPSKSKKKKNTTEVVKIVEDQIPPAAATTTLAPVKAAVVKDIKEKQTDNIATNNTQVIPGSKNVEEKQEKPSVPTRPKGTATAAKTTKTTQNAMKVDTVQVATKVATSPSTAVSAKNDETHSNELSAMLYSEEKEKKENGEKVSKLSHKMFQGHHVPMEKRRSMRDKIQKNMEIKARIAKSELGKFDKFCATIVTLMYLCYPVLIKSTFQLVACMPIGKNSYLQRDLNIRCWETDSAGNFTGVHFMFVLYLFLPGVVLWVAGMPFLTYVVLNANKDYLYHKTMKFRMGV